MSFETEPLRRSPFAGTWYPADPEELRDMIVRQLDAAGPSVVLPRGSRLVGLVSPHAGLVYSGPVAASGYRLLASPGAHDFETVLLLGPSHRVYFEGLALYPRGRFWTPLGEVEIDFELAAAIAAGTNRARAMPEVHAREHCLEMQLPFLQHLLPGVRIVPIVMGDQTRETIDVAARAIAGAISRSERKVLLVASSDLSHYQSRERARELDSEVLDCLERFDAEGLEQLLEMERGHACGGGPIVSVLKASRELGAVESRLLRYGDSGDASGELDAVVGYASAALYGPEEATD